MPWKYFADDINSVWLNLERSCVIPCHISPQAKHSLNTIALCLHTVFKCFQIWLIPVFLSASVSRSSGSSGACNISRLVLHIQSKNRLAFPSSTLLFRSMFLRWHTQMDSNNHEGSIL